MALRVAPRRGGGAASSAPVEPLFVEPEAWVRPADWLPMPAATPGQNIIAALVAIYPNRANAFAFVANPFGALSSIAIGRTGGGFQIGDQVSLGYGDVIEVDTLGPNSHGVLDTYEITSVNGAWAASEPFTSSFGPGTVTTVDGDGRPLTIAFDGGPPTVSDAGGVQWQITHLTKHANVSSLTVVQDGTGIATAHIVSGGSNVERGGLFYAGPITGTGAGAVFEVVEITGPSGFSVDFGDGTRTDYGPGETAEHLYDFDAYDPENATLTAEGHKQALVLITPQGGGALDFARFKQHSDAIELNEFDLLVLDVLANAPALTGLATDMSARMMQRCALGQNAFANFGDYSPLWNYSDRLEALTFQELNSVVNAQYLATGNDRVRSLSVPAMPLCEDGSYMVTDCPALEVARIGDIGAQVDDSTEIDLSYMVSSCPAVRGVFQGNVGGPTHTAGPKRLFMYRDDSALTHVQMGDSALGTYDSYQWGSARTPAWIKLGNVRGNGDIGGWEPSDDFETRELVEWFEVGDISNTTGLYDVFRNLPRCHTLKIGVIGEGTEDIGDLWYDLPALQTLIVGGLPFATLTGIAGLGYQSGPPGGSRILGDMPNLGDAGAAFTGTLLEEVELGNVEACSSFYEFCYMSPRLRRVKIGNFDGNASFTSFAQRSYSLVSVEFGNMAGDASPPGFNISADSYKIGDLLDATYPGWAYFDYRVMTVGALPSAQGLSYAFQINHRMERLTIGSTAACLDFEGIHTDNFALKRGPDYDTSSGLTFPRMFQNCGSLESLPAYDLSNATDLEDFVWNCRSLKRSEVFGAKVAHSYIGCALNLAALVEIIGNLGTAPAPAAPTAGELIANAADRDFSSNTGNWTPNDPLAWAVTGGKLQKYYVSEVRLAESGLVEPMEPLATYRVQFDVTTTRAGRVYVGVLQGSLGDSGPLSVGSTSVDITGIAGEGSTQLAFGPADGWIGSIDNVSVTMIARAGTKLDLRDNPGAAFLTDEHLAVAEDKFWTVLY